jgi:hypothetical protein
MLHRDNVGPESRYQCFLASDTGVEVEHPNVKVHRLLVSYRAVVHPVDGCKW